MNTSTSYRVIIVGSGAGGAAAAYRLGVAGVRVLLLEKGLPLPLDGSTLEDDAVVVRGEFLSKEPWRDGRGNRICPEEHFNLGGKTKWYGAAIARYSAREFEPDVEIAARGWPIGAADLAPFYAEAEQLLGVRTFDCEPQLKKILDRLSAADKAWCSTPLPMALSPEILRNPREATHFDGFASVANLKGDAQSSFLKHLAGRANFSVRSDAEVVALLPAAADGARIAGVKLANGEELRAPIVLLAAGALHSPRLLERYIAGTALASQQRFTQVGRNLKKHLLTALVAVSAQEQTDLLRKTMITTHERFAHSSVQPLGFDGELIATLVPKIVPRTLARIVGRHSYGFFLQTEDGSHPGNRVIQGSERVMDYEEARAPRALAEHKAFTRAFRGALLRAGLLSFTQRTGLNGTAHVCGTLIAGKSRDDSVVSPEGAVFGIEGLYVVDGSVLPRSSRVNPSLSIYAWSLRVAQHLIESMPG